MGCFSREFTGTTWTGTSYEAAHVSGWVRRLESCTVSRPCPCEILNTGLLVKYPGPSWALSLVTHRQAQDAIQARLQAPGGTVMQCWSASANLSTESWRHGSPQSGELILLQMDCELTLNAIMHTGHFNNAWPTNHTICILEGPGGRRRSVGTAVMFCSNVHGDTVPVSVCSRSPPCTPHTDYILGAGLNSGQYLQQLWSGTNFIRTFWVWSYHNLPNCLLLLQAITSN